MSKRMTIGQLQEQINRRLGKFAGRKYDGLEFHRWYQEEVGNLLREMGVAEMECRVWGICAVINDAIDYDDRIAEICINFKRDKRYALGAGSGKILGIKAVFHDELLSLTWDDARRYLLEEERSKRIEELQEEIKAREAMNRKDMGTIAFLRGLEF